MPVQRHKTLRPGEGWTDAQQGDLFEVWGAPPAVLRAMGPPSRRTSPRPGQLFASSRASSCRGRGDCGHSADLCPPDQYHVKSQRYRWSHLFAPPPFGGARCDQLRTSIGHDLRSLRLRRDWRSSQRVFVLWSSRPQLAQLRSGHARHLSREAGHPVWQWELCTLGRLRYL